MVCEFVAHDLITGRLVGCTVRSWCPRLGVSCEPVFDIISRPDETVNITTLGQMTEFTHDMKTVVIVGNSTSAVTGNWLITPRSY